MPSRRELRESGLLPAASVGEHILKPFHNPCSTCDEKHTKQRPHLLQAAIRAIKRQLRASRVKKERKENKKEKTKKIKEDPLYTEDEADDEEESEDRGHRPTESSETLQGCCCAGLLIGT